MRGVPARAVTGRSAHRLTPRDWAAVRAFYGSALGGRQLWPTERAAAGASIWFLVGETLVEVTADRGDVAAVLALEVDAPYEWAERCWDAGFTVCVNDDAAGRPAVSVLDPFGRRIDLRWRTTTTRPRRGAGGEDL